MSAVYYQNVYYDADFCNSAGHALQKMGMLPAQRKSGRNGWASYLAGTSTNLVAHKGTISLPIDIDLKAAVEQMNAEAQSEDTAPAPGSM